MQVQSADGVVHEFPDGTNDAVIDRAMKSYAQERQAEKPNVAADVAKSGGVGVAKGGIALLGLPGDLAELGARGIDRATKFIGGKLGVDVPDRPDRAPTYGSADIQKAVESQTGEFYQPKTLPGKYAQTTGEFAAGLAGGGGLGALGRRAVTQVLAPGLASEATGQAASKFIGESAEPYGKVVGALAGGLAPSAIARAVTPNPISPSRQRLLDILEGEGVTSLTAGQRTGSDALRYSESALGNAPFSGGRASAITREGQEQFTEAAMRRAGAGPDATPEVLRNNNARLGNEFETLSNRNNLTFDQQFVTDASRAIRSYERVPQSQQRAMVEGYVNDIAAHMQTGTMPGTYYQEMRSRLSRQANGLRNSDPTLSEALRDLRNSLDNAMRRSISPADREAWDTARRQYGAQKTIQKATSRAGELTAEGQIVPANLRNAASVENRGAYARGEGQFSELARAGSAIMKEMPQSGTAPRSMLYNLANIGTAGALPAALGRGLMSGPVQGYLANQVAAPLINQMGQRRSALVDALMSAQQQRLESQR
jgi:hypothetical protein